jgi:hypothetical protein
MIRKLCEDPSWNKENLKFVVAFEEPYFAAPHHTPEVQSRSYTVGSTHRLKYHQYFLLQRRIPAASAAIDHQPVDTLS